MICFIRKYCIPLGLLIAVSVLPAWAGEGTAVVEGLQHTLLSVMKDAKTLGYEGRYRKLEPVIKTSHNLPAVAQLSIGKKQWQRLTKEQKASYVDLFTELSLATYASQFKGYDGETFSVVSEKPLPRGTILVETVLTQSDGKQVHFNYLLRKTGQTWKIINIIVDGVSDLALKRAEYQHVLEEKGFPGLLAQLKTQIEEYRREK